MHILNILSITNCIFCLSVNFSHVRPRRTTTAGFAPPANACSPQLSAAPDHKSIRRFTAAGRIEITPKLIGKVMSDNDPFYSPSTDNPFSSMKRFKKGHKLMNCEHLSRESPPLSPRQPHNVRRSKSLPGSPVLHRHKRRDPRHGDLKSPPTRGGSTSISHSRTAYNMRKLGSDSDETWSERPSQEVERKPSD